MTKVIDIASMLGKTTYEAYWRALGPGGLTWNDLTQAERNAWYQAAVAIRVGSQRNRPE